jgi:S-methylmethionine-dependent homocysteine/selenocysteine methylase
VTGPLGSLLARRTPLLLDGAIGTLLAERGVDTGLPLWSAGALLSAPAAVRRIHVEYLLAGADILTTDTFRTTGRTFVAAGLPDTSAELTAQAVALALEARAQTGRTEALIAGSMGPLEDCYRPDLVPPEEDIRREQREHADRLVNAGVDFLFLETMGTIGESRIAATCAHATGKEFAVSFLVTGRGTLYSGETLADAVHAIAPLEPAFISINCVSPRQAEGALEQLLGALGALPVPAGIYANVGRPGGENDPVFVCDVAPDEYARFGRDWSRRGVRVIGGCCGTGPAHIAALRREFYPLSHTPDLLHAP